MDDRTLKDVLQSTSDRIFPAEIGAAEVRIDSRDADGDTPLHVLIGRGDTGGALLLISHAAPLDAVGDMGETPLHVAVAHRNLKIIKALLRAGARTDIVSEFGDTAPQKAAKLGIPFDDRM